MRPFSQIFKLHRLLRNARYPVSLKRIQETLECSTSTARRTISDLRDELDAPIEYSDHPPGYRYTNDAYELPGIWFSSPELQSLVLLQHLLQNFEPGLLDDALAPLREKLDEILRKQGISADIGKRVRLLKMAARPPGPCFGEVVSAALGRWRLSMRYAARSTERVTQREVSPQRLTHYRDKWYLDAWCHRQNALRTFSLDCIEKAVVLDTAAIDIADEVLDQELGAAYGIFSGPPTAVACLCFTADYARWIEGEQWHPQQRMRRLASGRLLLEVPYSRMDELILDIMRYGPYVEVIDPPELREAIAERLRAAAAQYESKTKKTTKQIRRRKSP